MVLFIKQLTRQPTAQFVLPGWGWANYLITRKFRIGVVERQGRQPYAWTVFSATP